MKKRVLILSDRMNSRNMLINLGDRALMSGLYNLIKKNLGYEIIPGSWKTYPYFTIKRFDKKHITTSDIEKIFNDMFIYATKYSDKQVAFEKKVSNFLDKSIIFNNSIIKKINKKVQDKYTRGIIETLKPYILRKYYTSNFITKVKQADVVLFNGAGLIADHLKYYLPAFLFEIYLAKKLGKKVIAVNQTVAVKEPLTFALVSFVYKLVDAHILREPLSKEVLLRMGVKQEKIYVSPDSAFAIGKKVKGDIGKIMQKEGIKEGCIGLIIRGDRQINYNLWIRAICYIQQRYNKNVIFLYTCKSYDEHVFKIISKKCGMRTLSTYYDYPILIKIMSHLDFIITDRYHGAIFAILANTPVIPVEATTFKLKGLFELFNYPIQITDNANTLIKNIQVVVEKEKELKILLSKVKMDLIKRVSEDTKIIEKVVANNEIFLQGQNK